MATVITEISSLSPYSSISNILTPEAIEARFSPASDYIEYIIKSNTSNFQLVNYAYNGYTFPNNGTVTSNVISSIEINPEKDLIERGLTLGNYNVYYSFYRNELFSSPSNQSFFIKEISPDRTELTLRSTDLNFSEGLITFFKEGISAQSAYYKDFYLNFGDNILTVANNIDYNPATKDILINLYEPLPNNISVNTSLWIVTQIANTLAFNIVSTPDIVQTPQTFSNIKGPNFNLPTKDKINNSTDYIDSTQLLTTNLSSSYNQLNSLLAEKGIEINIDYNDFSNFVHFSSAAQRVENFAYKVGLLETYNNEISIINSISGSTSQSLHISSSTTILQQKITDLITNFDGYEYFLYFTSGSNAWPKQNSVQPYILYPTTSSQAIAWLGSGLYTTSSYGGILSTASRYDEENKDYLYNTIPQYITDDNVNQPYVLFNQMVGQFFDNIWTYYKDVTNLYQADNRLDYGISKDLVSQALQSFGVNIYQNNFSTEDLYSAFLGYLGNPNTTNTLPVASSSGLEYINTVVSASNSASIEPLDDVNKEVYKRLYHNLPYLAKTKGTIPGLRALINCFGVPDTILRISEFGGRDKDTSTYDYFDQQFNYAAVASASANIYTPWFLASAWSSSVNSSKASSVQFRFKTSDFDSGSSYQLWNLSNAGAGTYPSSSLVLRYTGSYLATSSYSGSTVDPYYQHAHLTFYPKINDIVNTASVYLPFFDHGWWTVMINKFQDTYTLYAGNKLYYDGYDGNQIGYLASSSVTLANAPWTSSQNAAFLSSSIDINGVTYNRFTGSLQEVRYWLKTGSIDSFKDFIMNPQSIDYSGEILYDDYLVFRLPLGGELYTNSGSVHPRATGSWATTGSFISSNNAFLPNVTFTPNIESRLLNSPVVGLRGRVTDKIQIVDTIYPTGSVLSQYIPIAQSFPTSGSESPDVNLLEVAFSPQNEINDDIIDSLGYFNIGEYIGDPRQVSSSATSYPDLNALSNNFFQKYFSTYNLFDYIRLIKYFDNSLFKMIKDFVPARTSLTSGVVVKQHLLERNKYPQPQVYNTQYQNINVYSSSVGLYEVSNYGEDLTYSGSIQTAFFSGSTGGTFNDYNVLEPYQSIPFSVFGLSFYIDNEYPINYFTISSSIVTSNSPTNNNFSWDSSSGEITTYFYGDITLGAAGTDTPTDSIIFYFSSSQNGVVDSFTNSAASFGYVTPTISCSYGEKFSLWIEDGGGGPNSVNISFNINEIYPYSNQTWFQYYTGSTGVSTIIHSSQDEFYNGELPGTEFEITNGELNPDNEFKLPSTLEIYYDPTLYLSSLTPLDDFLNINTSPNQGEIYLWFDTGSVLNPAGGGGRQR